LDIRNIYQSICKNIDTRLFTASFFILIICLSNGLNLNNEFQFEIEKIELADSEFENDIEEKEKTKDSEKDLITNNDIEYFNIESALLSNLDFINRTSNYYSNIPTPPPDFL
jgi:hypothetical protein